MVTVATIGRIRRAFLVDKKPIRQIVRELRISRHTVRKAIRGSSTEFRYERQVQPQPIEQMEAEASGRGKSRMLEVLCRVAAHPEPSHRLP